MSTTGGDPPALRAAVTFAIVITRGETYYGDATIFGKPYATGYEPIKDASGNVIGIYFVGYMK